MSWRLGPRLSFRRSSSVLQMSPWTFALVGGPRLKGGYPDGEEFSDEVIEFDNENYLWKARCGWKSWSWSWFVVFAAGHFGQSMFLFYLFPL